jgi:hypothetical protein
MPCVYTTPAGLCSGEAPLHKKEHYLPRALGNFKDDERLVDRICNSCQGVFSRLEDVFAHNGPEAFFHGMVRRVGRKNHRGETIFYEPTMGISSLTVLGRMPGHDFDIPWEPVSEIGCQPMSKPTSELALASLCSRIALGASFFCRN